MKALTLTQPWATLVAMGAKRIETRSWRTSYRGPLAIHAAKGFPRSAMGLCFNDPFRSALGWPKPPSEGGISQDWIKEINGLIKTLPRGEVVAVSYLSACFPTMSTGCLAGVFEYHTELDSDQERAFGNYDDGRYAWILGAVHQLNPPIPAKGAQSLWSWEKL